MDKTCVEGRREVDERKEVSVLRCFVHIKGTGRVGFIKGCM